MFFQTMGVRKNNPTRPLAGIFLRTDDRTVVAANLTVRNGPIFA